MGDYATTGYNFVKDIFLYMKGKHRFVEKLDENFEMLSDAVNILDGWRKHIQEQAARNEITQEMISPCKIWIDQVQKIMENFEKTKKRYENVFVCSKEIEKLCCNGVPTTSSVQNNKDEHTKVKKIKNPKRNFFKLAKLSKDIIDRFEEVHRVDERMKLEDFLIDKKPEQIEMMQADDIHDFPMHYEKVKELLKHLEDETVKSIGIHGPPGVGTTLILKALNDELKHMQEFDMVIWVTVGNEESSTRKIQNAVARKLELTLHDDDNNGRVASIISRALQKRKYLLLLDEVYWEINLFDVGIHDNHKHGKVVVGAINEHVLKKMKPDHAIHVEILSDADAWNLFRKYTGDVIDGERIKGTAERILRELGGLPPVIKTIGLYLKDLYDEFAWNSILVSLQAPTESNDHELQELAGVYFAYKLVYDKLTPDRQKCLLYGALFPQDYQICKNYLIESWRAERFIPDIRPLGAENDHQLYRAARDRGHEILRKLTGTCLLDWSTTMEYVKMPVLFRKVALRLPYPHEDSCKVLVRAGEWLTEFPSEEEWRDAKRISLMCNNLWSLPSKPECLNTSALLLQRNVHLTMIENSFFGPMRELQVLDLSQTRISGLPSSICSLTNLKGLYLQDCDHLAALPADIKRLKNLEVLDIRGTAIEHLPIGIGFMVQLRCLRFSFSRNLDTTRNKVDSVRYGNFWILKMFAGLQQERTRVIIPQNLIRKLSNLEELTIDIHHSEKSWDLNANDIAKEVASLKRLTTLCFSFPNQTALETFVNESHSWRNENTPWGGQIFRSFNIQVGFHQTHNSNGFDCCVRDLAHERRLQLSVGEPTAGGAIGKVLKQSNTFELRGHETVTNLSDLGMENMKGLELCVIQSCNVMVSVNADNRTVALPLLEKLHLINLQELQCIQNGLVVDGSFAKLITLTLNNCPLLREVLTASMSRGLLQLQHLRIENCQLTSRIIGTTQNQRQHGEIIEEEEVANEVLTKLKILELINLQNLDSICEDSSLGWPSLTELEIRDCEMLRNLSLKTENAIQLKVVKCGKDWWRQLDLEEGLNLRLDPLCCFIQDDLPSTAYATPPEVVDGNLNR